MDRDEFMELVYETFADEPDNVLANGIIEAADAYVEYEKAKLFSEGTTSDTISRQAAIDAIHCNIVVTGRENAELVAKTMGEFVDRIKALPTIQPEKRTEERMETHACDLISRQALCEYALNQKDKSVTPNDIMRFPSAQPEKQWIPGSERLPENRVSVIVCFREWQQYAKRYVYSIVVGWYARKHSVHENIFSDWEADCEYDEIEDEYYIEEGWYEFTTQGNGDLMNWYINADVIAWMPLPEAYKPNK